jgi:hypothetical protein
MPRHLVRDAGIAAIIIELIRHHNRRGNSRRTRSPVVLVLAVLIFLFIATHLVLVLAISASTVYMVTRKYRSHSLRRSARYGPEIPYRSEAGRAQYENYQDRETEKAYRKLHGDDDEEIPF